MKLRWLLFCLAIIAEAGCTRPVESTVPVDLTGGRNAPTVFNSGFNFRQFWDGRAATLEDQIDGPIAAPGEMV